MTRGLPLGLLSREMAIRTLGSVVQGLREGVILADERGRPLLINPAARTLLSLPAGGSQGPGLQSTADGRALLSQLAGVVRQRGEAGPRELTMGGSPPRRLAMRTTRLTGVRGEVRGVVAFLEDVTSQREADLLQSEFVAAISHELRTPLSCVKNYVDMVLDRRAGELNPTQERFLGTARRNVERLTHLIDNLLALSESAEDRTEPPPVAVDLAALAEASLEALNPEMEEREMKLDVDLPEWGLEVQGDGERLGQALATLLRQAVKVGDRGTRIIVRGGVEAREKLRIPREEGPLLEECGRWAWMSVELTETGVKPAEARELFRRFRGGQPNEGRSLALTGLSLAIARNLVESQEGLLWAESAPGGSLRFRLVLPPEGRSPHQGELMQRLRTLLERAKRDARDLSLVSVRLRPPEEGEEETRAGEGGWENPLRAVADVARRSLRHEDRIFTDSDEAEVVLLLEGTDSHGATVVANRLSERLSSFVVDSPATFGGLVLEMGRATFPEEGVTAHEIVALARRRCAPVLTPSGLTAQGGD